MRNGQYLRVGLFRVAGLRENHYCFGEQSVF